ncbi:MAG: TetR/AcrR family transcriptional regulator [Cellvibrionaceae bacterium]
MANTPQHRAKLIKSAIILFRRQGFAGTGLSEILKKSGAPKGSLYHYFPNGKEELATEALKVAGKTVERTLLQLAEKHKQPEQLVRNYFKLLGKWMKESNFRSGCPITTTVLEMVPTSEAISKVSLHIFESWKKVIAKSLVDSGNSKSDAKLKADFIITTVSGALIQSRVQQSTLPLDNAAKQLTLLLTT